MFIMKNIFIAILITFTIVNTAYSQSDEQYKPTSGITTEVGFTPFTSSGNPAIQLSYLNVRWFFKPDYALKLGLTVDYYSASQDHTFEVNPATHESKGFGIALNPGIEKHFTGTDRLSPFVGAELNIRTNTAKSLTVYDSLTRFGAPDEEIIYGKSDEFKNSYLGAGVGLIAGTDFYITKNLYLGVEFSYGINYYFPAKRTRKIDGKEIDMYTSKQDIFSLNSSSGGLLRLGWKF